jgi:predicted dehydrogenase
MKWCVIGAGGIADRRTIPGLLLDEGSELVAVMDKAPAVAEAVGKKYGVPAFSDEKEMLKAVECDAVYISTPVMCHYEQAMAALEAGRHVLLEKPVASTSEESEKLVEAFKKAGKQLSIGYMMKMHNLHGKAKELIAADGIGQVVNVRAQFCCWYPDIPGAWRQIKALGGGGAMMDLGVHCIDLLQYISGQKITRLSGLCSNLTFDYEIDDSASVLFQTEKGTHGYVDANFNVRDDVSDTKLEFYGTKGSIVCYGTVSQEEIGKTKVSITLKGQGYDINHEKGEQEVYELTHVKESLYKKEVESFGDSILNGTPVQVPATDGAYVQKICEATYEASEKGIWISL